MKRPLPNYQIGDVVPVPADADLNLAQIQMAKRGLLARNARSAHRSAAGITAKRIMAGLSEAERIRTDPFERAQTFLRRKGFVPVCAIEGRRFRVGRHTFAKQAEVIEFAKSKGFEG
ncbi:hypothetical protein NUH86_10775 [Sphingobium sp. JS3065]|uniref:hypothetical protein n=1 Tax=Sphingobium sp. JS3065 TaxID=2970925 RepID=UPI0022644EC3|nr:hypothetical protein [Sphingobium sp. JS3065]UZW54018.1 hypothetical protein NUH86_10775 [Sphingobium sp. JS3065]